MNFKKLSTTLVLLGLSTICCASDENELVIEIDGQAVEKIALPEKAQIILVETILEDDGPADEGYIEDEIDLEEETVTERKTSRDISSERIETSESMKLLLAKLPSREALEPSKNSHPFQLELEEIEDSELDYKSL